MTEDTEKKVTKKSDKSVFGKTRDKNKKEKLKPLTKVVIRHLPPTMAEEEFLKQIDPLPEYDFYYYVPADWSLRFDATCRAYINFKNQEDIYLFRDRFDGYVFVDNKGAEYPAIVEFAAFQGLPKNRSRKNDPKANTIEQDQHYISFLEKLGNEENLEPKLEFTLQTNKEVKITSTPLLQYLANKKQERRDDRKKRAEEKRRQRDDEKQKKKITIAQKQPPPIKEEVNKDGNKDKNVEKRKDERNDRERDRKEARSKRRGEKRRQEREMRNKDRENEKNSQENKNIDSKPSTSVDDKNSQNRNNKISKDDEQPQRKEVKKYSQSRRDKLRARNENKTDENQKKLSPESTVKMEKAESPIEEKREEINEVVRDFINSVSKIKEFVPRNRDNASDKDENQLPSQSKVSQENLNELNEKLENISLNKNQNNSGDQSINKKNTDKNSVDEKNNQGNNSSRRESRSSSSANEKNEKNIAQEKKEREIRRIRNKDRPSLVIYQPFKLRTRSDGTSSAEPPKEPKSNPTSDCEGTKHVEKDNKSVRKKVSRYSERRSTRMREYVNDEFSDNNRIRRHSSDVGSGGDNKTVDIELKKQISLDNESMNENEMKFDAENIDECNEGINKEIEVKTFIETCENSQTLMEKNESADNKIEQENDLTVIPREIIVETKQNIIEEDSDVKVPGDVDIIDPVIEN